MTPSDIKCEYPGCGAKPGEKCTTGKRIHLMANPSISAPETLDYHHAERVDAWAREVAADVKFLMRAAVSASEGG